MGCLAEYIHLAFGWHGIGTERGKDSVLDLDLGECASRWLKGLPPRCGQSRTGSFFFLALNKLYLGELLAKELQAHGSLIWAIVALAAIILLFCSFLDLHLHFLG